MNSLLFFIIVIPIIEIYLFIEIGSKIGAVLTILLILSTAFIGIIYVRYEGFNTLRSAMGQLIKNEIPLFEIVSGAALVIGAFLLLLPGFLTDAIGILLIFPITRKMIFKKVSSKYKEKNKFIDGEYKDLDEK
jgi:Protein affecting phage T7 exclusion by the F plasmid